MSAASMILFVVFFVLAVVACLIDRRRLVGYFAPVALVFWFCGMINALWLGVLISAGITAFAPLAVFAYRVRTRRRLEKIIRNFPRY